MEINNWQTKKLGEVCDKISLNKIKIKQKDYLFEGKYPVIDQGQELIGGYFDNKDLLVPHEPPYIVFGDHTKVKKYIPFKFIAGADGVKVLKAKDNVVPKFLYYLLHTIKIENKGYARHFQLLEKESFLLPNDKETQQTIVSKIEELFSELDQGIAELKKAQKQLKTYRQSVLKYAFEGRFTNLNIKEGELPEGWEVSSIGEIFEIFIGSTPKRNIPEYWGGNVNWLSSGEIAFCNITTTREKITEEGLKNSACKVHPKGTVIIAMVGEGKTRGQAAVLKIPSAHNQNTAVIRVDEKNYSSMLLYYYLVLKYEENRRVGSGNNQKALNKERVKGIQIPVPPLSEQQQIVQEIESRLSVADKMAETINESLQKAEVLRQSILKRAFSGELIDQKSETLSH